VAESASLKKKLVEAENRSMILSQELERLQYSSKIRDGELERYRSVSQENETLKSRISQIEYSLTTRTDSEISRIKSDYEQRMEALSRSQGTELQSRIQTYEKEQDRLRTALKAKGEECEQLRSRAYELEVALKRLEVESASKIKNYELAVSNFKRENEDYYNRLKTAAENERRVLELQTKLTQCEREIERVTINVKSREEEILALRSKLRETEGVVQRYEFETGKSKTGYEQSVSSLRGENEALSRRMGELVAESNEKLQLAAGEIERLGGLLRTRTEERAQLELRYGQLEAKYKQTAGELETARSALLKASSENEDQRRRLGEYEVKLNSLFNEGNSSIRALSQENDQLKAQLGELRKQLADLKNQANLLEFESNKKVTILEQNVTVLGRENEELKRRVNDY
jgi:chromosome segregation ATPase